VRLHREERGDGPPVLLVHAGVADLRMWEPLAERLAAAGRRTVACDLRGFGRSELPPGRFSHAADLVELLDDLAIERIAVVGASWGGKVALELALRAPERVSAIALLDSALDEFDASAELEAYAEAEEAAVEAGDLDAATELTLRMWVDRPGRSGVDPAARELVRAMQQRAYEVQDGVDAEEEELDPPLADRLGEVAAPALVVVGDDDVADFQAIAERLARELPNAAPLVRIAGAAHLPGLERPDEVAEALLAFLRRHAPA
jgi:3-oxoadipate enol-lactonase